MTFVDAESKNRRTPGVIPLHGAAGFAGMRKAGRLTAEALDMLVEHVKPGAAYLAMASGASVVPLVFLGTRPPGGSTNALPPPRSPMVMTFGTPMQVERHPWPRRQPETHALSARIRESLRATLAEAVEATGMMLPGPIPGDDEEVL